MAETASIHQDKRTAKRLKLDENGVLFDLNNSKVPIRLIDVSKTGMKIAGVDLVADQFITLEWQGYEIDAVVKWSIGEASGIQFDYELEDDHPLLKVVTQ